MSIEKRFYVIPSCVIRNIMSKDIKKYHINIEENTDFSKIECDMNILDDAESTNTLRFIHMVDYQLCESINKKKLSNKEINILYFIRSAFSENIYNIMKSRDVKWYFKSLDRLCLAFKTMSILLQYHISDTNNKNWFDPIFKILSGNYFIEEFLSNYEKEFSDEINMVKTIESVAPYKIYFTY